jgi:hypothetical protein
MSNDPPKPSPDTLLNPIRQTLIMLLWNQPATAGRLEEVTKHPRKVLDYHLKVLVDEQWVEVERAGEEIAYRTVPRAHLSLPVGSGDTERVLALSLLDATWATLGAASALPLTPVWKTFAVDDVGLTDGSKIIRDCLQRLEHVVTESKLRWEGGQKGKSHQLVAVASLVPVEPP